MFYTSVTKVVVTMMRMIIINIMKMMIRPTFCECTKLCMSGEFLKKSDQALLVNIRWRLVIKILWDSLIWKWEMKKHFFALFCTITLILANIQPCRMFSYSVWRLSAGWDGWHISKTIAQLHIFNPITHSCDILWPRKTFSPSQRCLMANSTMSRKLRNLSHLGIVEQLLTKIEGARWLCEKRMVHKCMICGWTEKSGLGKFLQKGKGVRRRPYPCCLRITLISQFIKPSFITI